MQSPQKGQITHPLSMQDNVNFYQITGFHFCHLNVYSLMRKFDVFGGVLVIYIMSNLNYSDTELERLNRSDANIECQWFTIKQENLYRKNNYL